jgi:selenocysteine-specific elongation factor
MTLVIGTAGHIDHGKTTLLRALTGIDADRLPEEQRRGMTIDVGYAHTRLDDGTELDFVDVPGHDRLIGNMLVGAGEVDAAMLVVAADDGPRAQTLEHLGLLDGLGIADGIAIVTKADAVGSDRAGEVAGQVRALLDETSWSGAPVIVASGVTGDGIDAVRSALVELRDRVHGREGGKRPHSGARLAIDRVFAVRGRGTVVTGSLRGGTLTNDARLRLVPGGDHVRVRGLQVHGLDLDVASGGRTAINVSGIDPDRLTRGAVLTDDPDVVATDRILVALRPAASFARATDRPSVPADRSRVHVHAGTARVEAVVGRSGRDTADLENGEVVAVLRLAEPIATAAGDTLVLRRPSPAATLAGGRVLDADPARGVSRRRSAPDRLAALAAAAPRSEAWLAARLDLHGAVGSPRPGLASDVDRWLTERVSLSIAGAADGTLSRSGLRSEVARALRHRVTIEPAAAANVASGAIDRAVAAGRLRAEGDRLLDPERAAAGPDPNLAAAMDRLEQALDNAAPPPLAEAARRAGCPPAGIRALEADDRIVVLDDDLAYAASAYRTLERQALALAAKGPLTPASFRDATGTSRKYVMAILEDLGRRGILRRTPDGHLPGPRAAIEVGP